MSSLSSALTQQSLLDHLRTPWPRPGDGRTGERWHQLTAVARRDLPLVKVVEPHHDAVAIIADLGGAEVQPDQIWAVWAAEPPFAVLRGDEADDAWTVSGTKAFCSGAALVTHALVTAETADGSRLFAIELDERTRVDDQAPQWVGSGMRRAGTHTLTFAEVPATPVGPAGAYTDRPGFWWGAIGIAAAWYGGALGIADLLESAQRLDAHGLAHRGALRSELDTLGLVLDAAAATADVESLATHDVERLALSVRTRAAAVVDETISRVGRALGPGPLAFDAAHAGRVDDLQVFVRQHHAERDLASLGSWEDNDA